MEKKRVSEKREKEILAISQIFIFIVGFFAIAYAIGDEVKLVSAKTVLPKTKTQKSGGTLPIDTTKGATSTGTSLKTGSIYTDKAGGTYERVDGEWKYSDNPNAKGGVKDKSILDGDKNGKYVDESIKNGKVYPKDAAGATGIKSTFGTGVGVLGDHLGQGLLWSGYAFMAIQALKMAGLNSDFADSLTLAAFGGIMSGQLVAGLTSPAQFGANGQITEAGGLLGEGGAWTGSKFSGAGSGSSMGLSLGVGIAVGLIILVKTYKQESQYVVKFDCLPWEAPKGGQNCEECNKQGELPCSEYQCKSLGQACELLNDEESGDALCVWVNRNDVDYPRITPLENALPTGYEYTNTQTFPNGDRGTSIVYTGDQETSSTEVNGRDIQCAPAFTPITFGLSLDEPGKCKIDTVRKETFDEMDIYLSSGIFDYNHTFGLSLPGTANLESQNMSVENGGVYSIYTRCQDANGNYNPAHFVFSFCIDDGPDTTAPLIVGTSTVNGAPIAYNTTQWPMEVYTNEPVENCKWSHEDERYDQMEYTMTCYNGLLEQNAQLVYRCTLTLDGLKDDYENKFYFRCQDLEENTNVESYKFTLWGTNPLIMTTVGPNGTIKDSTENVKVTLTAQTFGGYKEGTSDCYYKLLEQDGEEVTASAYVKFLNTNSHTHSQDLWLTQGNYTYNVRCVDLGGNADDMNTSFIVISDYEAPLVVRAYHEDPYLVVITNEDAECVYDTADCTYVFTDGIAMNVVDGTIHYAEWATDNTMYIKCKDSYGKEPNPDECSMIVRAFENPTSE